VRDVFFHTYLFEGQDELGKSTIARRFAQAALCEAKIRPCFECVSCKKVQSGNAEQIKTLDSKVISIKDVRTIKKETSLKTTGKRFWIIDQYEKSTKEAQNALLKMLEEPQSGVHFIIIARNKNAVLSTIVSRSFLVRFYPVEEKIISDFLVQNNCTPSQEVLTAIAGRPGRAVALVEDGTLDHIRYSNLLTEVLSGSLAARMKYAEMIYKDEQVDVLLITWITVFRDIMRVRVKGEELDEQNTVFKRYSLLHLEKILENLHAALSLLKRRVNKRLIVENICINI